MRLFVFGYFLSIRSLGRAPLPRRDRGVGGDIAGSFFRFLRARVCAVTGWDDAVPMVPRRRAEVDLTEGVLTVRAGKRGRTRLVPLHPTAIAPLRDYTNEREQRYGPPPGDAAFFRTDRSDHIDYSSAQSTFQRLRR